IYGHSVLLKTEDFARPDCVFPTNLVVWHFILAFGYENRAGTNEHVNIFALLACRYVHPQVWLLFFRRRHEAPDTVIGMSLDPGLHGISHIVGTDIRRRLPAVLRPHA